MRSFVFGVALVSLAACASSADQQVLAIPEGELVRSVRDVLDAGDFAQADRMVDVIRQERGMSPVLLEAMSWRGRAALAAGRLDDAEAYATEVYEIGIAELENRGMDDEERFPIAFSAAIEVLGQASAARSNVTDAVMFLERELDRYDGTSIVKRIQKNIHIVSLEGKPAPAIDISEYLGEEPPPLEELRGKAVLLFFWAHWCSDCKSQAPILAEIAAKYEDQGLALYAPTQRFGYVADEVQAPPDVERPPTLVLVDRDGIVRLYHPGRMTLEELEPLVQDLLTPAG
jgi:thiol-disulfide isomerase/thioredoxin